MKLPFKSRLLLLPTILLLLCMTLAAGGCSTRKNTAANRRYQAFITRYNIYYNGDEHYRETLSSMENGYEDDYTSGLIYPHPADARSDQHAPQPQGDFTRSIEKAQKAIQLRSIKQRPARKSGRTSDPSYRAWMKREEYNPFLHNAWLMMGRSQYNNGDYIGAASTFYYISRHFTWLPATVAEAKIWQARSYISMGWMYEAENLLSKIQEDSLTSSALTKIFNQTYAYYHSRTATPEKAIPYLKNAIKYTKGAQRSRLYFLLGQIYARNGRKNEAYKAFGNSSAAAALYRTRLNARIRQSEVYSGTDIKKEVNALKRLTRYERNNEYLDQIYYAIGNLYLSRRDTAQAIKNYILASDNSTRHGIDNAVNQLALGRIYFVRGQYDKAQPCYAEAVPLLPENYPGIDSIKRISDVLDELAIYAQNVSLNDSLLALSYLSKEQQIKVAENLIADLRRREEQEEERRRREEYLTQQQGNTIQNTGNAAASPMSFAINNDDSWYFYNTATRNAGKSEFQKRWGSRKLEDDWRRRNKSSFSFDDFRTDNESDTTSHVSDDSMISNDSTVTSDGNINDPHNVDYYLRQIPSTPEERVAAKDIIQEGMYNIGLILKDRLDNYKAAAEEWQMLLDKYPDNIYRLDIYYNMYLMYMRHELTAQADIWRKLIVSEFPESKQGKAMQDPQYFDKLRNMHAEQESLYTKTYQAYIENKNAEVHSAYHDMMRRFPLSELMPKFMFLHALSYVTDNDPDNFSAVLRELLARYPDTELTELASSYLRDIAQGKQLHSGVSNVRGMIWNLRLGNDSIADTTDSLTFDLNPEEPHLMVFAYPTDEVSGNQLLYDVARHNFSSFIVKDFDLEMMNFGRLGLLLVKGFANFDELAHYRSVMDADKQLTLPEQVRPVMISVKNFNMLLQHGRSLDEYFRFVDSEASIQPVKTAPGSLDAPDAPNKGYRDIAGDDDTPFDMPPIQQE